MHHRISMAIAFVALCMGRAAAQERVPLPPPDPQRGTSSAAPALPPPVESSVPPPPPYSAEPPPNAPPPPPYGPGPGPYPSPYPYPPPAYPARVVYGRAIDANDPCFWIGAEGLIWWTKSQPLSVPIVTTGPASQGANAGALGAPGTTSLTQPLDLGTTGGVRIYLGGWFNTDRTIGMDGSVIILGQNSSHFGVSDASGTGQFVINEPVAGAPFVTQVSAPGLETGFVSVDARSQFGGGDVNMLYNLHRRNGLTVNLLGGFRYLQLDESLSINASSNVFVTTTFVDNFGNVLVSAPPGSNISVGDFFGTHNQFYGGQIGAQVQYPIGRWSINGIGKLAIGGTHEVVNVSGNTNVFPVGGAPVGLGGGNFATIQGGHYAIDRFAFAPELQMNLGFQFTPWMRGTVGYSFLYLSSVARPGNQIDNLFDGVAHPMVPMASSSFWAQGLNLGLHFSY
jgi:hypothetical protein